MPIAHRVRGGRWGFARESTYGKGQGVNCKKCEKVISMPEVILVSKWVVLDLKNLRCWDCHFEEVTA